MEADVIDLLGQEERPKKSDVDFQLNIGKTGKFNIWSKSVAHALEGMQEGYDWIRLSASYVGKISQHDNILAFEPDGLDRSLYVITTDKLRELIKQCFEVMETPYFIVKVKGTITEIPRHGEEGTFRLIDFLENWPQENCIAK